MPYRTAVLALAAGLLLAGCSAGGEADDAASAASTAVTGADDGRFCDSINRLAQPTVQAVSQTPPSIMAVGYLQQIETALNPVGLSISAKMGAAADAVKSAAAELKLQFDSGAALSGDDLTSAIADMQTLCTSEGHASDGR